MEIDAPRSLTKLVVSTKKLSDSGLCLAGAWGLEDFYGSPNVQARNVDGIDQTRDCFTMRGVGLALLSATSDSRSAFIGKVIMEMNA